MKNTGSQLTDIKIRQIFREEFRREFQLEKIDLIDKDRFDSKMIEFKSQIFDLLDKIMVELKLIREEQNVITGKVSEQTDELGDLESRLTKLETVS